MGLLWSSIESCKRSQIESGNGKKIYETKLNRIPDTLILMEWDKLRKLMWSENCTINPAGFVDSIQKVAKKG